MKQTQAQQQQSVLIAILLINHTTSAYENTTTLAQVPTTDNISKPTVVAPANQAAILLDNHESCIQSNHSRDLMRPSPLN